MGVDDFLAEQEYHVDKQRLQNRILFGSGVVSGLESSAERDRVTVRPGIAIDCVGREIVVPETQIVEVPRGRERIYVGLCYVEREVEPMAVYPQDDTAPATEASMIEEGFEIIVGTEPLSGEHAPRGSHYEPCGQDHPVPLATLRREGGRLRLLST